MLLLQCRATIRHHSFDDTKNMLQNDCLQCTREKDLCLLAGLLTMSKRLLLHSVKSLNDVHQVFVSDRAMHFA